MRWRPDVAWRRTLDERPRVSGALAAADELDLAAEHRHDITLALPHHERLLSHRILLVV
jgi:hypothetical protein